MPITRKAVVLPKAAMLAVLCFALWGVLVSRAEQLRVGKVVAQNFGFVSKLYTEAFLPKK